MTIPLEKADNDSPYRIDDRVTVHAGIRAESADIADGPTLPVNSGTRVNEDQWPSASGT